MSIMFVIKEETSDDYEEYIYELKWWNQKGRYETNTIAIKNYTSIKNYEMLTGISSFEDEKDNYYKGNKSIK